MPLDCSWQWIEIGRWPLSVLGRSKLLNGRVIYMKMNCLSQGEIRWQAILHYKRNMSLVFIFHNKDFRVISFQENGVVSLLHASPFKTIVAVVWELLVWILFFFPSSKTWNGRWTQHKWVVSLAQCQTPVLWSYTTALDMFLPFYSIHSLFLYCKM